MVSGTRRVAASLAALVVLGVGAEAASAHSFDLEGHRGTRGLRPENTLAAFGKALEVGVTTLELDTGVTKDGVVVVSHERRISTLECQDTGPAVAGDPEFPYVGKLIKDLTYAQLATLDDAATMQRVIDLGVDGLISNDVDLLQLVARRNGLE